MDPGIPAEVMDNAVRLVVNFATVFGIVLGLVICRRA
jgi:hypothetical protein